MSRSKRARQLRALERQRLHIADLKRQIKETEEEMWKSVKEVEGDFEYKEGDIVLFPNFAVLKITHISKGLTLTDRILSGMELVPAVQLIGCYRASVIGEWTGTANMTFPLYEVKDWKLLQRQ